MSYYSCSKGSDGITRISSFVKDRSADLVIDTDSFEWEIIKEIDTKACQSCYLTSIDLTQTKIVIIKSYAFAYSNVKISRNSPKNWI